MNSLSQIGAKIQRVQRMNFSDVELPSNRKFGFFFSCIFAIAAAYLFAAGPESWAFPMSLLSLVLFVVSAAKPEILLPLNKAWMRLGLLIGMVVSPIVLGTLFFGIFTPVAFGMRICRRDELSLKFSEKQSHWISRKETSQQGSFKNQF